MSFAHTLSNKQEPMPKRINAQMDTADILTCGRRVLDLEIQGLEALSRTLDERFVAAVHLVRAARGRVVLSGMGKSGHVARKIAATLASTGTPAQFVHPAEASHGDLGMITSDDCIVALSNSGETTELSDLIGYAQRFGIPLIAMTSNSDSSLGRSADVVLEVPAVAEACAEVSAPTTSTTMMMVYGDALAIAVLEDRGFSASDFRLFHPGGKIGAALATVDTLMHIDTEMPRVTASATVAEAIMEMTTKGFGCTAICNDDGLLLGALTDGDLRRHMGNDLLGRSVSEVMTHHPKTIAPNALLSEAVHLMTDERPRVTALFVTDPASRLLGVLHMHDCLRAGVV
ncbi:KpsF/GutQ family sugar-phosphate isomerase [Xanthobacter sp. DSM 24535]|uniref:KpsF/GutQ family sugar-phosphate isomerase n=1 Tax=Roseixanthobacter psychrophilus TaxID=3119917 RepID=UPI00372A0F23